MHIKNNRKKTESNLQTQGLKFEASVQVLL